MERMFKTNPNVQCLFAISRCKGMDPFYFSEVKGLVHHHMKLSPLVTSGWVVSKRRPGERIRVYRMTREAYRRVTRLFAADTEEEVLVHEEHRTTISVFQESRITRIIQSIWENEPQAGADAGCMEVTV